MAKKIQSDDLDNILDFLKDAFIYSIYENEAIQLVDKPNIDDDDLINSFWLKPALHRVYDFSNDCCSIKNTIKLKI